MLFRSGSRSDTTLDQQRWAQDTHEAFDAYLEQRWDDALRAYQRCLVMQPDDGVAQRRYERCSSEERRVGEEGVSEGAPTRGEELDKPREGV